MEPIYVIINFLILAAIIVLFCRKIIISIFKTRRDRILNELREAEEIEGFVMPEWKEPEFGSTQLSEPAELKQEQELLDEKIKLVQKFFNRECN